MIINIFGKKDLRNFTDELLMREVERGDHAAFDLLYERYANRMFAYFFRMMNNDRVRAEDMLQELFMKVIECTSSFNTNHKFSTWLYALATNMCRNEWRDTANRHRLLKHFEPWEVRPETGANERIDAKYFKIAVSELIEEMGDMEKEVLHLRFQQELSIREIATITNQPEGTVKSKIFYLLKKLAKHLKEYSNL